MRKIFSLLLVALCVSCQSDNVIDKLDTDFADNRWGADTIKSFSFTIEKEGEYDVYVRFSHVAGFQFREIPIELSLTTPNAPVYLLTQSLKVVDESGKDKGDCSGDICDLEQRFTSRLTLLPGQYVATLQQRFPNAYLPNVLGAGIRITPSSNK